MIASILVKPKNEKLYEGKWRIILKNQYDNQRFKHILRDSSWSAFNLPANPGKRGAFVTIKFLIINKEERIMQMKAKARHFLFEKIVFKISIMLR